MDEERVRFVSASKAVGSLFGSKSVRSEEKEKDEDEEDQRNKSQIFVRVASCGLKTDLIEYNEGKYKYLTTIDIPLENLLQLKPDDFYKRKVWDEQKQSNYTQVMMKRRKLDFWLKLCEHDESRMIFDHKFNERIEKMGIVEPF